MASNPDELSAEQIAAFEAFTATVRQIAAQRLTKYGHRAETAVGHDAMIEAPLTEAELVAAADPVLYDVLADAAVDGAVGVGLSLGQDIGVYDPAVERIAAEHIAAVKSWLPEMVNEMTSWVQEGLREGYSIEEMVASLDAPTDVGGSTPRIRAGSPISDARARTIARTECLPGDALITGANVSVVYRRPYSGEWVEVITRSGRKFAGTPNHPMLTPAGWRGLGELTEGDHLIRHDIDVKSPGTTSDEDVDRPPTTIAEIFDALTTVLVPMRERTGQPDFHGDGINGYVDVLRPDRLLRYGRFAALSKRSLQHILSPSSQREVLSACRNAPFRRDLSVDEMLRLSVVPEGYAGRLEDTNDHVYIDAVAHGKGLRSNACPVVEGDGTFRQIRLSGQRYGIRSASMTHARCLTHRTTRDAPPPQFSQQDIAVAAELRRGRTSTLASEVQLDEVIAVLHGQQAPTHVYNLSTYEGYFQYDGAYTGNTVGASNGGTFAAYKASGFEQKTWLCQLDNRTRLEHAALHHETIPMDADFIVGGEPAKYPGSSSLSASMRASCRCTLLVGDDYPLTSDHELALRSEALGLPTNVSREEQLLALMARPSGDPLAEPVRSVSNEAEQVGAPHELARESLPEEKPSSLVSFATPAAQKAYGPVMADLDKLHRVTPGVLGPTEVIKGGKAKNQGGHFAPSKREMAKPSRKKGEPYQAFWDRLREWDDSPQRPEIKVLDRGDGTEAFSFLHEFGHRVDFKGLSGQSFMWESAQQSEAALAFQAAAKQTETITGAFSRFRGKVGYVTYFRSDYEVWARGYSQWAAEEMGGRYKVALDATRAAEPGFQWSDEEFRTLGPLVRAVLKERGLVD